MTPTAYPRSAVVSAQTKASAAISMSLMGGMVGVKLEAGRLESTLPAAKRRARVGQHRPTAVRTLDFAHIVEAAVLVSAAVLRTILVRFPDVFRARHPVTA